VATDTQPPHPSGLQVAVIGAGPAGFYASEALLKAGARVDLIDRLPFPHGLVRYGVAPDHQHTKGATKLFDRTAGMPGFRFFGNVEFGTDLELKQLREQYHAVLLCVGCQAGRRLGIPGEDLASCYSSLSFVNGYNGHPDAVDFAPDLSSEAAVVVGNGNVALDVARLLLKPSEALQETDIPEAVLAGFAQSKIRTVHVLGRRGLEHSSFRSPEIAELAKMESLQVEIRNPEIANEPEERAQQKVVATIQALTTPRPTASRKLILHYHTKVVDWDGSRARCVDTRLTETAARKTEAQGSTADIPAGLLVSCIGYLGVEQSDLPFDHGTIPNAAGFVQPGVYVAGWIKRGPSGLIGNNKACARESAERLLADFADQELTPREPDWFGSMSKPTFSYDDWLALDSEEKARGKILDRPRIKFRTAAEAAGFLEKS